MNSDEEMDGRQQTTSETILWTVEGTANQLMVSSKTVKRLIEEGELPIVPIRGCIRVPKQAVLDWVEAQTRYNLGCVGTTCASTGEKPCQSLNVVMEEVEITTSMSDTDLEKRLNDLREHGTNG
jgi:excisionase family DNA binding protein